MYRARDTRLHRDVAIKILPRALVDDADFRVRLEREARLLAALNHPQIAKIYGVEEWNREPAIVMELVEGDTLERLDPQRAGLAAGSRFDVGAADRGGVSAAHDRGIVLIARCLDDAFEEATPAFARGTR